MLELLTVTHSKLPAIYAACLSIVTMQVTLLEDGNKEVALTIKGLTEYGYLLAVDIQGTAFALHPDGNRYCQLSCRCPWEVTVKVNALFGCSLDFFQGLIRHKLSS